MNGAAVRPALDPAGALQRLRAVEPHAVDGCTAEQMAAGCALLEVVEQGVCVGAVAVDITGDEATIKAAASDGVCTVAELLMIEAALKRCGVRRVGVFTRRAGLVRNLSRQGYTLKSAELIKEL